MINIRNVMLDYRALSQRSKREQLQGRIVDMR